MQNNQGKLLKEPWPIDIRAPKMTLLQYLFIAILCALTRHLCLYAFFPFFHFKVLIIYNGVSVSILAQPLAPILIHLMYKFDPYNTDTATRPTFYGY
jgi:hypothetical protein